MKYQVNERVYYYDTNNGEYYPSRIIGIDIFDCYVIKCLIDGKWIEFNNVEEDDLQSRGHIEILENFKDSEKEVLDAIEAFNNKDKEEKEEDLVNSPSHYTQGNIEVIEAIEDWKLGYHLGNAIKYIARCEHKGNKKQDLAKAIWYLQREIDKED